MFLRRRQESLASAPMLKDDYPGLDFLGLQDILRAKTRWYKTLWLVVLIVNTVLGLLCTAQIVIEYLATPTATLISYKSTGKMLLPQVTVCGTVPDHTNFDDFYRFAVHQLQREENSTLLHVLVYILAGSGFQKFDHVVLAWNESYIDETLTPIYEQLRGNMTAKEFFHFGQDAFGFQCSDLFQQCKLGEEDLDCCQIFKPTYTIRRGKCFRSQELYQSSYDEMGKLGLRFKEPKKLFPSLSGQELMIFLNEYKTDIDPFPRNYMYAHDFNKFRVRATRMQLIQRDGVCENENEIGKSTCYLEKWLIEHVEQRFNCAYPYMDTLRDTNGVEPCEPSVIVKNYARAVQGDGYDAHDCKLACNRTEYDIGIERTDSDFSKAPYKYRADINYNDLQYQRIEEVNTITLLGLISQLGGQLGLFLGTSVIDVVQLGLILSIVASRYAKTVMYGEPDTASITKVRLETPKLQ